ncbi:MAG: C39 family peptidase, partial [Patescibacteria group bacterium]
MALFKRLIIVFLLFFLLISPKATYSESEDEVLRKIADLERQLGAAQDRKNTLSGEITYMDNQIDLTRLRITETENKLGKIADDISSVSGKISTLEDALAFNSKVVVNRIVTTYKNGQPDPIFLMLLADNFENFTQRLAYLRMVQRHDKVLLEQMSLSRKNYADQKNDLNVRKKQVETLKAQLNAYKVQLDSQKKEKQRLLEVTQNDETRYQSLLAEARAQLAAFKGFVGSLGGASILSNQTSCDGWGCYYNQRDSQWGLSTIGRSHDTMAEVGCLVTSSAMVLSHYGRRVTPGQVARINDAFFAQTALMLLSPWSIDGATFVRTNYGRNLSKLDEELSAGHPVIVGIGNGPDHFVVIRSKDGSDYKMYDPFVANGKDISFNSKYSQSSISVVNVVRVN